MKTMDKCPVCDSWMVQMLKNVGVAPVFDSKLDDITMRVAIYASYCRCLQCGVIFQNPRLDDLDIVKFYSTGLYRRLLPQTEEKIDKDEMLRAEWDKKLLDNMGIEKPKSHLDIGCSRGFFLDKVDADVQVGVEINPEWVKLGSPKLEVFNKVEDVERYEFDMVSIIHTLEHVPDPIHLLDEAICRTAWNGHLVIEVPSYESPGGWERMPHLYHFEPWVLVAILKKMGLKIDFITFTPHLLIVASFE